MHTDILVSMLCEHTGDQLNELVTKAAQDVSTTAVQFEDQVLVRMLPIVDMLRESDDLVLKRAFLLVALTLSATLQQWVYGDAPNSVLPSNVYTATRVVSRYAHLYLDFKITESELVAKVLRKHCVA